MPIFSNFRATNVWKAFILNSILTSIVILVSITSKQYLDNYIDIDGDKNKIVHKTNFKSLIITLLVTFVISMISYTIMYFTFGYGSGMLAIN